MRAGGLRREKHALQTIFLVPLLPGPGGRGHSAAGAGAASPGASAQDAGSQGPISSLVLSLLLPKNCTSLDGVGDVQR